MSAHRHNNGQRDICEICDDHFVTHGQALVDLRDHYHCGVVIPICSDCRKFFDDHRPRDMAIRTYSVFHGGPILT